MVSNFITRSINRAAPDALIFNRNYLNYGARNAVDVCLHRLAQTGLIKRLARGIYIRWDCKKRFTAQELGEAKAKQFNRTVNKHPADTASDLKLIKAKRGNADSTFHAEGRNTSFQTNTGRIIYQATSARRLALKKLKTGDTINALWWLKKERATEEHVISILKTMKRQEKEEFLWSHERMPGWLSDLVHSANDWKLFFPLKKR
jgi:hypothetical protein